MSIRSHKKQDLIGNVGGVNTESRWGGGVKGEDRKNIIVENITNNIFALESLRMNIFETWENCEELRLTAHFSTKVLLASWPTIVSMALLGSPSRL